MIDKVYIKWSFFNFKKITIINNERGYKSEFKHKNI